MVKNNLATFPWFFSNHAEASLEDLRQSPSLAAADGIIFAWRLATQQATFLFPLSNWAAAIFDDDSATWTGEREPKSRSNTFDRRPRRHSRFGWLTRLGWQYYYIEKGKSARAGIVTLRDLGQREKGDARASLERITAIRSTRVQLFTPRDCCWPSEEHTHEQNLRPRYLKSG